MALAYLYFSRFAITFAAGMFIFMIYRSKNIIFNCYPQVIVYDIKGQPVLKSANKYLYFGRGRGHDLGIKDRTVSRHAFVASLEKEHCLIQRIGAGVLQINGKDIHESVSVLNDGDRFRIADDVFDLSFQDAEPLPKSFHLSLLALFSAVQILLMGQLLVNREVPFFEILISYGVLWSIELVYTLVAVYLFKKNNLIVEFIGFLFSGIALAVSATEGGDILHNTIFVTIGIILFSTGNVLFEAYENSSRKFRSAVSVCAAVFVLVLLVWLALSPPLYEGGPKLSIYIYGMSFLPLIIVQLLFIFILSNVSIGESNFFSSLLASLVLACTAIFSVFVYKELGVLLVMLILTLAGMVFRTGRLEGPLLAIFAGIASFPFFIAKSPTFAARWYSVGSALESGLVNQQSDAISCGLSAGGLFGVGLGKGLLHRAQATESDLIMSLISEELGLLLLLMLISLFGILTMVGMLNAKQRSLSGYVAGCLSVTMIVSLLLLGTLGSLDYIAFTGVNIPFLSEGGSNAFCSWILLIPLSARIGSSVNRKEAK